MSKHNPELERALMNAMAGLKDMKRKKEIDRDKKLWSPISLPIRLQEVLTQQTKYELDETRKALALKGVSTLKKAELIELLLEKIPQHLVHMFRLFDERRFSLLSLIVNKGGHMKAPTLEKEQIDYLRKLGLIFTGTIDGKKIVGVPEDLHDTILKLQKDDKINALVKRNTEWITLSFGLLYYYGTLSTSQLLEMLESYTKAPVDYNEFIKVILNANEFYKELTIDKFGLSNWRVFDPERVKREHEMRKKVPYYPFTKSQLLKAGEPGYVERNDSYRELVKFLVKNFDVSRENADTYAEECVYATRIGESPNSVIEYLGGNIEFPSFESVQALLEKVIELMNSTREWFLKGYTSAELVVEEKKHLQQLPGGKNKIDPSISKSKSIKQEIKVGRNEPCPCGSGKKYKKCCG
ncbi:MULTISPECIES: YecA family protein [Bacillaceae]|uniref:SEC-C domain-containing protein n=1 Tax=Evansella alkalicola TaxID=745819 RepID=A0ABS6K1T8_9BACI|nr:MULTISPECIES: SEC-C metal-binding domain-containing protein [Bacillaceae]MBU9723345.1 SEC-C domain-containing protein [Bacillus alkalicola]